MVSEFVSNPFYSPENPKALPTYGTPISAILSVLHQHAGAIFSYKAISDSDLFDKSLKKWVTRDINDVYFNEVDLTVNAGAAPLGYAKTSDKITGIITPGFGLPYFIDSFKKNVNNSRFVFNVGTLDYDKKSCSLINDYTVPLAAAERLGFPVISPININEVQATSLFAIIAAKYSTSNNVIHLFDGINLSKTVLKIQEKLTIDEQAIKEIESHLSVNPTFEDVLDEFNETTGQKLHNFEYFGDRHAETVFVTYGVIENQLFKDSIEGSLSKVGLLSIRIPLPFSKDRFVAHVPSTTKKIVIITQYSDNTNPCFLKSQISHALFTSNRRSISVSDYLYEPTFAWTPSAVSQIVSIFVPNFESKQKFSDGKNFIFWASDKSTNLNLASRIIYGVSLGDTTSISLRTKFNNIVNGGIFQAQFSANQKDSTVSISNIDNSDVTIVEDHSLLKSVDVVATAKLGSTLIVLSKKTFAEKDLNNSDFFTKDLDIPENVLVKFVEKKLNLIFIDAEVIGNIKNASGDELSFVTQFLFWKHAYQYDTDKAVRYIWESSCPDKELPASFIEKTILDLIDSTVIEIKLDVFENVIIDKDIDQKSQLIAYLQDSSFTPNPSTVESERDITIDSSLDISKLLTFKEAYKTSSSLRPDLPVKNFVVKVKENRRITPTTYDRNIFHIEFDISGTGLTYGIGEALGIHARNNETLVNEFIETYGLNGNDIISVPNKDNNRLYESRTVLQAFIENLDIFGKPPKRFYESLVEFATDENEKKRLQDLIEPAGAVDLKRYQDVEFFTYADILELFPSARPPLEKLVEVIAPLKRREYSIASSQKVHPNEVHLLIVVVDWVDNKGRNRFGQASKYISDLQVGTELVVSVKPSVMKLPPNPEQPVIMSGLGTGLAPFKAIIEEKVWQKQQGYNIGEVYLYLGSRHKKEEYLYGELWEAYKDAGVITHIGAAFSRDQPEKIYIQDRIRENLKELKSAMIDKQGYFYLCGPTWPVPDITAVLQDIISADAKDRGVKIDLNAAIEDLKDSSRYILEVY
ncbi:hypothetical protein TPHA_0C01450 [Tetrapisispora phaffii CBS 4417]|uniref:assimilatory sulfite reductase (NADPH) n=1 Tax=Tetrapisispora phaffii (strain ATCC 24235 / CBS 4417 / NBRC 1672 / NRRL Y-8282 / UCD 70-5) TaxID=1071381 RepID=G8BRC5_TETPH|nr:hypothetical protein TPHA_0C01450 [Tetrapisispora phaffii CBS 4417]CCE62301.1 hypothetical protein TPHA_0C01450 [Tetrapisispora phaffii CBS 4417]